MLDPPLSGIFAISPTHPPCALAHRAPPKSMEVAGHDTKSGAPQPHTFGGLRGRRGGAPDTIGSFGTRVRPDVLLLGNVMTGLRCKHSEIAFN